jgi:hypothetical protein
MKQEQNKKPEPKIQPKPKKKMPSDKDYLAALGPCGK